MALGAVEMMRFLYDICRKLNTKGGISDTKIGLKSGNTFTDFLHYTGNFKRCFSVYSNRCTLRPKCRTKFSDYAGKPYGIGIFANGAV